MEPPPLTLTYIHYFECYVQHSTASLGRVFGQASTSLMPTRPLMSFTSHRSLDQLRTPFAQQALELNADVVAGCAHRKRERCLCEGEVGERCVTRAPSGYWPASRKTDYVPSLIGRLSCRLLPYQSTIELPLALGPLHGKRMFVHAGVMSYTLPPASR